MRGTSPLGAGQYGSLEPEAGEAGASSGSGGAAVVSAAEENDKPDQHEKHREPVHGSSLLPENGCTMSSHSSRSAKYLSRLRSEIRA